MLHQTNYRRGAQRHSRHGRDLTGTISLNRRASELRQQLQDRGPEHSCFGLYLASRIDILPAEVCRELALITDAAAPIPAAGIRNMIVQELGHHWERSITDFEETPCESTLISQSHRAWLRTGTAVKLMVLRPQYHTGPALIGADLLADYCDGRTIARVLADFNAALSRKTNFLVLRDALESMRQDAANFDLLQSHASYPELSSTRLLAVEDKEEMTLAQAADIDSRDNELLAARLCHVWLYQALQGHCFPVDAQLHNILLNHANQLSFVQCDLVGLPSGVKENISNYFGAMLADDPDRASTYLLREMERPVNVKTDFEAFRTGFRQAAYFGMLEPVLGTRSDTIPQMVFQHCKLALNHGYIPRAHLLCFYRGFFSTARIAYKLAPHGDPMREGLTELRITSSFTQVRTMMDWRHWYENSDRFASALLHLPRTIDDALTRAATLHQPAIHTDKVAATRQAQRTFLLELLVLLALISICFFETGIQSQKTILLILLIAGFLLLRQRET